MARINDSATERELKATVNAMALRVNQLERLLDGKEIGETASYDGATRRTIKLSLNNGMKTTEFKPVPLRWQ